MVAQAFDLQTLRGNRPGDLPWLIVGKGPSFSRYEPAHHNSHHVLALNHAMRGTCALVGHAIDIEVLQQLSLGDVEGMEWLALPWVPHVRQQRPFYRGQAFFGPGRRTLPEYADEIPVLRDYLARNRVVSYNFSTAPPTQRHPGLPTIAGDYSFSAAVAFRLLAQCGARVIRTLGVDGGNAYGAAFRDIEAHTKLQTAQTSFDAQFQQMANTMNEIDVLAGPLDAQVPARVFVGCMPEQDLAFRVLEYSIHRHASLSVKVERLHEAIERRGLDIPQPAAPENRGRTPFSFQRFAIPRLCDYAGRAAYVDSDMLVLRDLRSMWSFDMDGLQMASATQPAGSGRRPQFSVMLIDCERLRWDVADLVRRLDAGEFNYSQLMYEMASVERWRDALPETWNSLEHYEPDHTCLVHFTDMDGQPWLNPLHPLGPLWARYLLDAVRDGAIELAFVRKEVELGNVRPSVLAQIERGEADPRRLPFGVLRRDLTDFFPPHRRGGHRLSRWKHEAYRARTLAAHAWSERLVNPTVRRARRLASSVISSVTPKP